MDDNLKYGSEAQVDYELESTQTPDPRPNDLQLD